MIKWLRARRQIAAMEIWWKHTEPPGGPFGVGCRICIIRAEGWLAAHDWANVDVEYRRCAQLIQESNNLR